MTKSPEPSRKPDASVEPVKETSRITDPAAESPEDLRVAEMLTHTIDVGALAGVVEQLAAADAADTLEDLEEDEATELLEQMKDDAAAEALAEMETPLAIGVLEDLVKENKGEYASHLLELMAPDDAADLLQAITKDNQRAALLALMSPEVVEQLVPLSAYDPESAGGLMTTDFIRLDQSMTVGDAIEFIRSGNVSEDTQYALVIDSDDRLVGLIGLRQLLLASNDTPVESLTERSVEAIHPELDQEEVARTFDRYDYSILPVIDYQDHVLGVVTVDDVIDIIRLEQTEDVQKSVGAGKGEAVYSSLQDKFRGRFPWLACSFVMTCMAASIVLLCGELIEQYRILPFLLVVIAPLVGNSGHQALAVTLRGIVLDEVRPDRVTPLIIREGAVGILNGAMLGIILFLFVLLLGQFNDSATWQLGGVAAIAMWASMSVGTLAGCAIPLAMKRFGFDPAQSSTIFLIMITDAISFITLILLTYALLPLPVTS